MSAGMMRTPAFYYCKGDPCWCGGHREPPPSHFAPWTQEAHDSFLAERKAARERRAKIEQRRDALPTTFHKVGDVE